MDGTTNGILSAWRTPDAPDWAAGAHLAVDAAGVAALRSRVLSVCAGGGSDRTTVRVVRPTADLLVAALPADVRRSVGRSPRSPNKLVFVRGDVSGGREAAAFEPCVLRARGTKYTVRGSAAALEHLVSCIASAVRRGSPEALPCRPATSPDPGDPSDAMRLWIWPMQSKDEADPRHANG